MNTNLIFRKNNFRLFLLLALTGLLLRGLYLFEFSHFAYFDLAVGADVGEYDSRANEILRGIIFPSSPEIHAPLYSFFLAALKKLGANIIAVRIIQTLLNYFSWLFLFFLLEKRNVPEKIRFVFLGCAMVLAPLIFHPAEIISEALLLPLAALLFFLFHLSEGEDKKQKIFSSFGAGLCGALLLLTHGMMAGFLFLETVYLAVRKKWLILIFWLVGIMVVLLPFLTFKSLHYHKLCGIQANTAFNIFLGNNPKSTGLCYMRPGNNWRKHHFLAEKAAEKRQISTDRYHWERIFNFWQKTPFKALGLYLKKIPLIFSGKEHIAGADGGFLFCRTDTMTFLRFLTFPVILLSFAGVWYLFRKKELCWAPALLMTVSLFLMQLLTVTSGRYRLLMFPGLLYLAAIAAVYVSWKKIWLPFAAVFLFSIWKTYSFMGADKAEGTALIAQAHFAKGNYEHAKELLLFSSKRFRDSSRIDNMLGNIAEKEGDLALARQYYSKVTQTEPFMPEGWMNLANIMPNPEKAENCFRRALKAAGKAPGADLTFNYARFLYAAKRYDEAEKFLAQTFQREVDHIMALNLSGLIAAEKKDFHRASTFFFKAAQLKPQEAGFWQNTAITARWAGNKALEQLAIRKYQEIIHK